MKFKGVYTALLSPTKSDGSIDRDALARLIESVLDARTDGLVPLGGTGEYCALSPSQRAEVVRATIEINRGRVPVIAGVLSPGFRESVDSALEFKSLGADGVMVVTPYYVTPTQRGFVEYFKKFISETQVPIALYNIPYRTNVNMLPESIAQLLDEERSGLIFGIKECVPSIAQVNRLINLVGDRIAVICGEEHYFFAEMLSGAAGGVLATSNLIPGVWRRMYDLLESGDVAGAREIHMALAEFLRLIFAESNPGPLKCAMEFAGLGCGDPLPPLVRPAPELMEAMRAEYTSLRERFDCAEVIG